MERVREGENVKQVNEMDKHGRILREKILVCEKFRDPAF